MKKVLYVLIVTILAIVSFETVNAAEGNVDLANVANKFNELGIKVEYEECDADDGKVTAKYNNGDGDKGITFSCKKSGEEAFITLKEENNTLNFKETKFTQEELDKAFEDSENVDEDYLRKYEAYVSAKFAIMDNFLDIFFAESGYSDLALPLEFNDDSDFLLKSYMVTIKPTIIWPFPRTAKVFFEKIDVEELKLSIVKEKIDAFVAKTGDKYIRKLMELTPTLELSNVTSNSVTLSPKVNLETEDGYKAMCYLYRSNTTEFNESTDMQGVLENCLTGAVITDDNLSANTTYYYAILLYGSTKFSDPIAVTTSGNLTPTPDKNTNPDNGKENPPTGIFVPIGLLSLFAIGGVATLIYTNKKNKFKNY